MIAFPTDKGGAAIRPHDDALDRELSYRMQQISKNVSPHHLLHGTFGNVGLSNILDSELIRREPAEGSHG